MTEAHRVVDALFVLSPRSIGQIESPSDAQFLARMAVGPIDDPEMVADVATSLWDRVRARMAGIAAVAAILALTGSAEASTTHRHVHHHHISAAQAYANGLAP